MTLFRPSSGTLKLGPSSATTPFSDGVLIAQMAGYRASDRQVGVKISGCNFSNDSKVLRCVYPIHARTYLKSSLPVKLHTEFSSTAGY